MNTLIKFLIFIRVIDQHDGMISLTNLTVIICLFKLALAPTASILDIGALLISLANYAGKKFINKNSQVTEEDSLKPQVDEIQKKIEDMSSQVSALNIQAGFKNLGGN